MYRKVNQMNMIIITFKIKEIYIIQNKFQEIINFYHNFHKINIFQIKLKKMEKYTLNNIKNK